MSQHDYIISNDTGANVRSDLNNALSAIATVNSGATAPSTTYAYQLWMDTANNVLKMRNSANSAWYTLPISPVANNTVDINAGTIDGATIGGSSAGAGTFTNLTSTGTTALQNVSTTNSALNISSSASDGSATIDASGNLLVGTNSYNSAVEGSALAADGFAYHTRDGNRVQVLNRLTSDGDIVDFRKDGTSVGSIGVDSSQVYLAGTGAGLKLGTANLRPTNGSGATSDNSVDLGSGSYRFKDAYLSGGVYLGGTGSANKLDDYEEGTWTPIYDTTNGDLANFDNSGPEGAYTKIGNTVHIYFRLSTANAASISGTGTVTIEGLPFSSSGRGSVAFSVGRWSTGPSYAQIGSGESRIVLFGPVYDTPFDVTNLNPANTASRNIFIGYGSYQTTA